LWLNTSYLLLPSNAGAVLPKKKQSHCKQRIKLSFQVVLERRKIAPKAP
jgi:hypothetical protein